MNTIICNISAPLRFICIFSIAVLGFASIIGSGDSGSSTNYDTLPVTIDFDQIDVDYDANNPTAATKACVTTSMLAEFTDADIPNAESLRIIDSSITSLQVSYRAAWSNVSSLQEILCTSTIEGQWDGPIDSTVLEFGGSSGWEDANGINNSTQVAFKNYFTNYRTEFQLCVSCNTSNLFNSYTLDYWISMDSTLTVAYDNEEETPAE